MRHFTAHRLHFLSEVQTPIELNEHQGSAIRGALFHVLRNQFCVQHQYDACQPCPLHAGCPVSFLLATVDDEAQRGADVPRPYTIEPPVGNAWRYAPGQTLEFGLTMFARALNLFPYVVVASHGLQREGLGSKTQSNGWRRGTFALRQIWAENSLTGERKQVMSGDDPLVSVPDVPITHEQITRAVDDLACDGVSLTFRTPTRLVDHGVLVRRPLFRPLLQRLFERLSALARAYCDTPLELDFRGLLELARLVELTEDRTQWVELDSYSTRRNAHTPLGGFLGQATYQGDLRPFLPWLVWGQFTHVGKDAVKGSGWYTLTGAQA